MDREKEINLALSACPPAVAKAAGVYVLTRSGYETARDSGNGFTAIVQHSALTATEPPYALVIVPVGGGGHTHSADD